MAPKAQPTKEKIRQIGFHQIWKMLASKDTIKRVGEKKKTSHRTGENICKSTSNKELTSRIQRDTLKTQRETKRFNLKVRKGMNRYFYKEDTEMTKKHMKIC